MAASLLGAFANPLDDASATAARVAAAAQAGGFDMPPVLGTVLSAVSVQTDPATTAANKVAAPSPAANVPAGDKPAEAPTGLKAWMSGWRLAVVVAGGLAGVWYLFGRRRG